MNKLQQKVKQTEDFWSSVGSFLFRKKILQILAKTKPGIYDHSKIFQESCLDKRVLLKKVPGND